ncbi:MAG: 5-oxoprolinase subunit PxpB [Bacillus sp. (in: firmicutes)]
MTYHLSPLGDHGIIIELGHEINKTIHKKVQQVAAFFESASLSWVIEYIPAFTTVTIIYDPISISMDHPDILPYDFVYREIQHYLSILSTETETMPRRIEIPVCYDGEFGPDLVNVAEYHNLTIEKVIELHTSAEYTVHMIGFAPGFPYLGGMPETLATPRRSSPRLRIPARSVGIAGGQTGIYPIETPGGWQLIGRTPLSLFKPDSNPPTLLQAGDLIRFTPIDYETYRRMEAGENH